MDIRVSKRVGILVIASMLLTSTVTAAAKPINLVTGAASARASDKLGCILSNVGTTPINVEFTLVNISSGEVAHTVGDGR